MSIPLTIPHKKNPNGSVQPSLVILTKDDFTTSFQKRRFNPDEFMNLFDKFKTNPFGPDYLNNSKDSRNRSSLGDFDYDYDSSPNGRRKRGSGDSPHNRGDIIDLASLSSDFDINKALGDEGSVFSNMDLDGQSTSAYSYYPGDEELFKKLQKQLNLSVFGDLFPQQFDDMEQSQKRQLGRMARLQMTQKRNWYNGIWKLFGLFDKQKKSKDRLWNNLRKFMKITENENDFNEDESINANGGDDKNQKKVRFRDGIEIADSDDDLNKNKKTVKRPWSEYDYITNDTVAKSLMYSAKKVFESFLISDKSGLNLSMRAVVVGPRNSGKTYYLRALLIHTLNYLIEGSQFKSLFIVPFDLSKAKIKTVTDFYNFMSKTVIESLLVQRTDLQLFQNSLRKAFSNLTVTSHVKRLPKPISSQDYLRQSMKEVDLLLQRMHRCYNDPDLIENFISNVAVLPETIGNIFNFDSTFCVIDHIDLLDIELKIKERKNQPIRLFEYMKFSLTQTQFLISCVDTSKLYKLMAPLNNASVDLRYISQIITVYDTCDSDHEHDMVKVNFVDNPIRSTLPITIDHCGGCPLFVCSYDDICDTYLRMKNDYLPLAIGEKNVELVTQANELIKKLFNCKTVPEIKDVTMDDYFEKEEEEEKNEKKT